MTRARQIAAHEKSIMGLAVLVLFLWMWPVWQWCLIDAIQFYGYDLKLGGGLLHLLLCALSILAAMVLSVFYCFEGRRGYAPLKLGRMLGISLALTLGISALITTFLVVTDMFCSVGSCPTPN